MSERVRVLLKPRAKKKRPKAWIRGMRRTRVRQKHDRAEALTGRNAW